MRKKTIGILVTSVAVCALCIVTDASAMAAAFSSGNSPIASQSRGPKVKYHPTSLPPTLSKSFGNGLLTIFRLCHHTLDGI
jgi:hypothetical protein